MTTQSRFKKCLKCKETFLLSSFYKHAEMADGHLNKCKACARKDASANRNKKIDHYREYDRRRANTPARVKGRERYKKTTAGKSVLKKAHHLWGIRNRHKRRAHLLVKRALNKGILQKGPCSICGALNVEAHHPDYSRPLFVVWLCKKDHHKIHKDLRAKEIFSPRVL